MDDELRKAAEILNNDGVVVLPTETVYGIGTNSLSDKGLNKLYELKNRPVNKPISVVISNKEMINKVAKNITERQWKVISKFFPGPLTIVLDKQDYLSDILTAGLNTIGVRMPDNEIALKLIELVGVPFATSSANVSGEPAFTNLSSIQEVFKDKIDYYIDGGDSKIGVASTVVRVTDDDVIILREGTISKEQIEEALK